MSYPYPDLEPGSFESYYDAQARTCPSCGVKTKGQQCPCEAPVEREKLLPVFEPAAVVLQARPYTFWFDARYGHTRQAAIQHARKYARLIRQPVEVL